MNARLSAGIAGLATLLLVLLLGLPVAAILTHNSPARLWASLGDQGARDALLLSAVTSGIALALIVALGTPAAYLLAARKFRGRAVLTTVIELPLVLPPAVAGIGLLAAFGPHGLLGHPLAEAGITLPLTTPAVVVALTFVAAPFYVRAAQTGFMAVDPRLLEAARSLGDTEAGAVWHVAIPVARPTLLAGAALALGRALGEFGATLMFAGSLRGVTQTAPLAIYERFATDLDSAIALSAVLLAVSAGLLVTTKLLGRTTA